MARKVHPAQPGDRLGDEQRRASSAHAGRHRACARGRHRDRRLHGAGAAPVADEQDHADPVELDGDASAHASGTGSAQLPHDEVLTDTRTLRFYYRLLPDNRVQIGSRSAITGADAPNPRHFELLMNGLHRKFPALRGIQIDYSWWGWVDVSHDMMPRVFQPDPKETVFYALGYGGNGVSYSSQAGRRLAERIAGKGAQQTLPIFTSPLPGHYVRAVPAPRTADALPLVFPARRIAIDAQPVSSPT